MAAGVAILLADYNENSLLEKLKLIRIWEYQLKKCKINTEIRWADLTASQQNLLAKQLCSEQFRIKGKTTFTEEFVTAGGINLNEINSSTMESKIVPHPFFAGEY